MTPENSEFLNKKHPAILSEIYFECGDGWVDLIDRLCCLLDQEMKNASYGKSEEDKIDLQPVASQVKEKFGGLRFYINGGSERMDGMISMAEHLSFTICEDCGNKGSKRGKGWIFTKCEPCWHQQETRRLL
jgi:hypothetical protein